jgi:hypothetical protein
MHRAPSTAPAASAVPTMAAPLPAGCPLGVVLRFVMGTCLTGVRAGRGEPEGASE